MVITQPVNKSVLNFHFSTVDLYEYLMLTKSEREKHNLNGINCLHRIDSVLLLPNLGVRLIMSALILRPLEYTLSKGHMSNFIHSIVSVLLSGNIISHFNFQVTRMLVYSAR